MKLQTKTLLITGAAVGLMFSALFALSAVVVWSGFAALERQDIRERAARARARPFIWNSGFSHE